MLEYVEECEDAEVPLVVFSCHTAPVMALSEREGWEVITGATSSEARAEIVRRFQAGELRGVALTIAAGGVGLTLTRAWKALFVDLDWTPALNWQAEDRICRIGQTNNKVLIVRMVSEHILDQHVLRLMSEKIAWIQGAIENTTEFVKPRVGSGVQETDEEFASRMREIEERQRAAELTQATAKVRHVMDREAAKAKQAGYLDKLMSLELNADRVEAIHEAWAAMLEVCDGATRRDGVGWNKPDAVVAHWIGITQFATDESLRTAHLMLTRYSGQLRERFPILWSD
jgi:hypothetical protein